MGWGGTDTHHWVAFLICSGLLEAQKILPRDFGILAGQSLCFRGHWCMQAELPLPSNGTQPPGSLLLVCHHTGVIELAEVERGTLVA